MGALRQVEQAIAVHRELQDPVREAEDLRILALALGRFGKARVAEDVFRQVIARATEHKRPLLVAKALRDLAHLLVREDRMLDAKAEAEEARATFERLGAPGEAEKLDTAERT